MLLIPHFHSKKITMKFLIALLAVFAVTNGQSCDQCTAGVNQLGQFLLTNPEIEAVEEGIIDLVCTNQADVGGCAAGIVAWWPQIAEALFAYPDTVPSICSGIGLCKRDLFKITCAGCEEGLGKIAALFSTDAFAKKVAMDLNGPIFCGNTDYIPAAQMDACTGFMDLIALDSVKALGTLLKASASRICTDNGCTKKF
jgi:hypothetical protein